MATFDRNEAAHGIYVSGVSRRRPANLAQLAAFDQATNHDPALGRTRLRIAVRGLPVLSVQDRRVRRRCCRGDLADAGPGRAWAHRRMVDAAHRVSEGGHLHAALRDPGPGLRIGTADRTVLAAVRWVSVLVAAQ